MIDKLLYYIDCMVSMLANNDLIDYTLTAYQTQYLPTTIVIIMLW